jgi:hypothetical protein
MKPLIPILIVATTSLAVASVQFHQQAAIQRERADAEMALRQKQEARVVQLERTQARLERDLMTARSGAGFSLPPARAGDRSPPPPPGTVAHAGRGAGVFTITEMGDGNAPRPLTFGAGRRPPFMESPAARNFMKTRMKSSLRRTYEDAGPALGLSAEKTNQLIDLLADQQTRGIGAEPPEGKTLQQFAREQQQKNQAEIAALVGEDKLDEWASYQKSLPDRMQLSQVRDQLDQAGVPMNESQRTELLAAISEESQRLPRPAWNTGLPPEESMAQMNQWQTEYDKALLDRAKQVLNTEQYKAYKEFQDWQTEMRNSMPRPMGPGGRAVTRMGISSGLDVTTEANVVIAAPLPAPPPQELR